MIQSEVKIFDGFKKKILMEHFIHELFSNYRRWGLMKNKFQLLGIKDYIVENVVRSYTGYILQISH